MNERTTSDLAFEAYLRQRRIPFRHEPFGNAGKSPDYLVEIKGKSILIEVKEIEELPLDKESKKGVRVSTLDPRDTYNILRDRIKKAGRQLKPYKDLVNYCVVLFGKPCGFTGIGLDNLFYAMYGDPCFAVPINVTTGVGDIRGSRTELKMVGALRRNDPKIRQMDTSRKHISGVGVIKEFNGRDYYKRKLFDQYLKTSRGKVTDRREAFEIAWEFYEKDHKIPKIYQDPDKMFYKIELINNPLSANPFIERLFNGKWDRIIFPSVVEG